MVSSPSAQRVAQAAARLGLDIELREYPEGTRTAGDAARAIGVEVAQIVKSLVFMTSTEGGSASGGGRRPVLCLVSGVNQLDTARLATLTGTADVRRATADEVERFTGFAIGGVPPFGHSTPLPIYCDRDLLAYDTVWAAAGTPRTVFAANPQRLAEACRATIADLKAP